MCVLPQVSATDCELDTVPPADALMNVALNYDAAGNVTVWRDAGRQDKLDSWTLPTTAWTG